MALVLETWWQQWSSHEQWHWEPNRWRHQERCSKFTNPVNNLNKIYNQSLTSFSQKLERGEYCTLQLLHKCVCISTYKRDRGTRLSVRKCFSLPLGVRNVGEVADLGQGPRSDMTRMPVMTEHMLTSVFARVEGVSPALEEYKQRGQTPGFRVYSLLSIFILYIQRLLRPFVFAYFCLCKLIH